MVTRSGLETPRQIASFSPVACAYRPATGPWMLSHRLENLVAQGQRHRKGTEPITRPAPVSGGVGLAPVHGAEQPATPNRSDPDSATLDRPPYARSDADR